jgi:Tfp pilus assembly protein PilF
MNRIDRIKEMLKEQPKDNFLRHALALELIKLNDDHSARIQFENILSDSPNYVGSYYHLGKLYERLNLNELAISTYENGMAACKKINDQHSYNELQSAYDDLVY